MITSLPACCCASCVVFHVCVGHRPVLFPCFLQGISGLAQHVRNHEPASLLLCQLYNHRASARLGLHRPAAALDDALSSIRVKRTFARGYLRAATCYTKMGLLGAAAAVLDTVRGE
jgi:hypothetical protein